MMKMQAKGDSIDIDQRQLTLVGLSSSNYNWSVNIITPICMHNHNHNKAWPRCPAPLFTLVSVSSNLRVQTCPQEQRLTSTSAICLLFTVSIQSQARCLQICLNLFGLPNILILSLFGLLIFDVKLRAAAGQHCHTGKDKKCLSSPLCTGTVTSKLLNCWLIIFR